MAIYLARRLRVDQSGEIGEKFQISRYGTVSSMLERMKVRLGSDDILRKKIDHLMSTMQTNESKADLTPLR